jgi:hypothetical protein
LICSLLARKTGARFFAVPPPGAAELVFCAPCATADRQSSAASNALMSLFMFSS